MVVFTCDACGESLKKNQVEKHYLQKCRNCNLLTCVDCLKDFPGDTYQEHTKCITEEERYSAKGWQPKANANKNAKKQEAWVDNIRSILSDRARELDSDVKNLLNTIVGFDNIPRKRAKFINFVQNALGRRTPAATIDKTWEVFEEALKGNSATNNKEVPKSSNEPEEETEATKPDKKKKKKDKENKEDNMEVETDKNKDIDEPEITDSKGEKKKKKKKHNQDDDDQQETADNSSLGEELQQSESELFNRGVKMFPGTKSIQNGHSSNGKTETLDENKQSNSKLSKSKKRKLDEENEEELDSKKSKIEESTPSGHPKKFDWEFAIRSLLLKKGSMKAKRLKKKIVDEYVTSHGETVKSRIQLESKLEKKLQKNKEFKYTKDTISLANSRTDD